MALLAAFAERSRMHASGWRRAKLMFHAVVTPKGNILVDNVETCVASTQLRSSPFARTFTAIEMGH